MKDDGSLILPPVSILLFVLLMLLVSSCGAGNLAVPDPTATAGSTAAVVPTATLPAGPVLGLATVESLEILKQDIFPVEVDIRVTGLLPNDCTVLDDIVVQRDGSAFTAAVTTVENPEPTCGDVPVTFEEIVPLDVAELPAGSYTVSVNSIQGSFNLEVDNMAQVEAVVEEPTPATTPSADAEQMFAIDGRVWHDLCSGVASEDGEPPAGCVIAEDGAIVADGLEEDEPGIAGVRVNLARGACPAAAALISATTGAEGTFSFSNLAAEQYCVYVDATDTQNEPLLQPGRWTTTTGDLAQIAVTVGESEATEEISFGWDYDLLPADLASCTNSFQFVEDLSVPDDTTFAPGEEFVKQWRLRNNGTCPWSSDYAIQFIGGDQMGAADSLPLPQTVPVSQTLDVEISMIAPLEPGTYRGNWQLAAPDGELFGINGNIEDAFWLQIIVDEQAAPAATPLPDSGSIGGAVWEDFCNNGNPGAGCVESDGASIADGSYDALDSAWAGITVSLAEGACPTDGALPENVISTAVTGDDGRYIFEGLSEGTYCIFMDAFSAANVDFLIPGNWTWPGTGVGQYSFILDPGEQALDLDFGWDYYE